MDIDPPLNNSSNLKRSNSAPMINVLDNQSSTHRDNSTSISPLLLSIPRTRRFSASFSPTYNNYSPQSHSAGVPLVVPSRVSQIKHEEGMDVVYRETVHEKEMQSKIQMSLSWEDLTLDDTAMGETNKRPKSLTDPLHIFTPPHGISTAASPTRTGKQCFSPSTCQPVRSSSYSPTPSPSPTRKTFSTRRSQSPISLRPSQFSVKRKYEGEIDNLDAFASPAKRLNSGIVTTEKGAHFLHPLAHSLPANNIEMVNSPDQTVPSEGTDITDSMSSSSGSPCGTFKPVEPATHTQDIPCRMEETSI